MALVGAGHVTIRIWVVIKYIYWAGGVVESFDNCCGILCGFRNFEQSLKTNRLIGIQSQILPMKNVAYLGRSFTKKKKIIKSVAEWSSNPSTVSIYKMLRSESK